MFSLDRGDWFFIILLLFVSLLMARPYIYTIQQDNYRLMTLLKSRRMKAMFAFDMLAVAVFLLVWAIIYFLHARAFWGYITTMFFFVTELALYFLEDLPDKKKPLRYTKRAVRGIISVALFATAATSCAFAFCNANVADIYMRYLVFFAFPIAFPLMFVAVIAFVNIFERLNNLRYEMRASRELTKNKNLIKIGITGSYGKTSVKNILAEMLKKDFNVLATPSSFNTPMGIAKTVKSLDATHEVFIAEMGARHTGDIKKLMKIVKPTHTILTGINNQHLETFKTEENIAREKFCVVNMLNSDGGFAVVTDKQRGRFNALINKKHSVKVPIFVGFDTESDVTIKNFNVTTRGSVFTLTLDGAEYVAETELLGEHNAENIALAAAMAFGLSVSPQNILNAISCLKPIPHRMQLIEGRGIRIIDDSFNGNPDGARVAIRTLGLFDTRRVVMTPGLVELGKSENEENYNLGREIAEVADVVLLVGKHRAGMINQGLKDAKFDGEVHFFDTLASAENEFQNILRLDDVLLILNDLPDFYNE